MAYLLLMAAAIPLLGSLKKLDWQVLAALDMHSSEWPKQVAVVDLEWDFDPAHIQVFRRHLAGTLNAMANLEQPPSMVILDVSISTIPFELEKIKAALDALRERHVHLIQVVDLEIFRSSLSKNQALIHQGSKELHNYSGIDFETDWDTNFGHASFKIEGGGTVSYDSCAPIKDLLQSDCIPAIPKLVSRQVTMTSIDEMSIEEFSIVFIPGDNKKAEPHVWQWSAKRGLHPFIQNSTKVASGLGGRIVVVGNMLHDHVGSWPGPALLGWAIGDMIATPDTPRTVLLRHPRWASVMALIFSGVALGLFAVLRRLDPRSRNIEWTTIGTLVGAVALLAIMVLILRHGLQSAYYQISYVLVGIFVTTGLARHSTLSEIRDRALYTNISHCEPSAPAKWDVFISYSHSPYENIRWVECNLVNPLRRMKTANGELKVFFDKSSIRIGNSWYMDLAEGIERSRCFVALYSSDYFRKSFCQFELRKAVVRDIVAQGRGFRILPFKLDANADPLPEFSHLQYRVPAIPAEMLQAVQAALAEQGIHAA